LIQGQEAEVRKPKADEVETQEFVNTATLGQHPLISQRGSTFLWKRKVAKETFAGIKHAIDSPTRMQVLLGELPKLHDATRGRFSINQCRAIKRTGESSNAHAP